METKIKKQLSKYYVKTLKEESSIEYYIDCGWGYDEDVGNMKIRLYLYAAFVKDLKKLLNAT